MNEFAMSTSLPYIAHIGGEAIIENQILVSSLIVISKEVPSLGTITGRADNSELFLRSFVNHSETWYK